MKNNYPFDKIEAKWQQKWRDMKIFQHDQSQGEPFYCLMMYPYPSGALHMGHVVNYTIGDALVRHAIMQGKRVLSPMGWDSFGLPAENAAIRDGIPPKISTSKNIDKMREQMNRTGWGYDWRVEIATSHPGYFRWTQWIFLQFYRAGLALRAKAPVNWCPSCATVLANEQVHEGKCERCSNVVVQKDLQQWFFKMSAYAQRLLDDHQKLRGYWPERVIRMQQEWIGRSEGARLDFQVKSSGQTLSVFTTRPDTIYGVTFMAIAPEHPLVETVRGSKREQEVMQAVQRMRNQSKIDRTSEEAEKEGIFLGDYVINPFDGSEIPLWVTNYALMDYGTGAVMAVPAHDQRDFLFARKYGLPLKVVIQPQTTELDATTMQQAYVGDGIQVNSGPFDGIANQEAMRVITQHAKEHSYGDFTINYRLKDWLLSRQRYWGAPIPIIYCDTCGEVPVPEEDLPVLLPENVEFKAGGESPLARCAQFVATQCPKCKGPGKRETDTMDTFVDSSWYFLRYLSSRDETQAFDRELVKQWLPVHQYIGGIEHATMHLIYARFFTKVLYDLQLIDVDEPFAKLFCQGMLCKTAYRCPQHIWVAAENVDMETMTHKGCGQKVEAEMAKMSKTKLNGVSPDELLNEYGADVMRSAILFMGPPSQSIEYNGNAMVGIQRFINRVWDTVNQYASAGRDAAIPENIGKSGRALRRKSHQTLHKVTATFVPDFPFNTAIAQLHELLNAIREYKDVEAPVIREAMTILVTCLSPFAPHVCEELWEIMGNSTSVLQSGWPKYDAEAAREEQIEIVLQVNGKIRSKAQIPIDMNRQQLEQQAMADEKIQQSIVGKKVLKVIIVPNKIVNIVAK